MERRGFLGAIIAGLALSPKAKVECWTFRSAHPSEQRVGYVWDSKGRDRSCEVPYDATSLMAQSARTHQPVDIALFELDEDGKQYLIWPHTGKRVAHGAVREYRPNGSFDGRMWRVPIRPEPIVAMRRHPLRFREVGP